MYSYRRHIVARYITITKPCLTCKFHKFSLLKLLTTSIF